jgi:hypothetical protein
MLGLMSFGAPSCLLIGGRTLAADSLPPESGADARRAQRTAILCCGVWEMSPSGADIYMLHYTHSTPQSHTPHHKARGATLEATPVLHARQFKNTGGEPRERLERDTVTDTTGHTEPVSELVTFVSGSCLLDCLLIPEV